MSKIMRNRLLMALIKYSNSVTLTLLMTTAYYNSLLSSQLPAVTIKKINNVTQKISFSFSLEKKMNQRELKLTFFNKSPHNNINNTINTNIVIDNEQKNQILSTIPSIKNYIILMKKWIFLPFNYSDTTYKIYLFLIALYICT